MGRECNISRGGQRGRIYVIGRWRIRGLEIGQGWGESATLAEGARLYSGGIHVGGVREGSHSVTAGGGQRQE